MDVFDIVPNYDNKFDDKNLVTKLLCDYTRLKEDHMFVDSYYFSRGENQDHVAGYAFDNIPIFNALTIDNHSSSTEEICSTEDCDTVDYHDALEAEVDTMDQCLTGTNLNHKLHYHSIGGCMKKFNTLLDGTTAPELCKLDKNCIKDPFKWAVYYKDN